ncbi:hypothetical protein GGG16DRAFT_42310 [Schizophyllum commune]
MSVGAAIIYRSVVQAVSRALFGTSASPSLPNDPLSLLDLPNESLNDIACLLDKRSLYALLLVNQRFHAIAEPVLWRELSSLVPILRLLPEYFEMNIRYPGPELPREVWERNPNITRLANHVRKLLIHPITAIDRDIKHATFYEAIGHTSMDWASIKAVRRSMPLSSDFVLFPRLQHLEVNSSFNNGINSEVLLPLIGPNVSTLEVHCPLTWLNRLARRCDIRSFAYLEPAPTIYGKLLPVIPRMALDIAALANMAHWIEALHTLRLRLNYGDGLLPLLRPAQSSLRVFDVEIGDLVEVVMDYGLASLCSLTVRKQKSAFVRALATSTRMETVELHDLIIQDANDFAEVIDKIGKDALRRVYIQERPPPRYQAPWYLDARHLEALASCPNLLVIDIRASRNISITDEEWGALAPSWPRLQYLRVQPCIPYRRERFPNVIPQVHAPPTATLATVASIALSCLYLEEMSIPLKMDKPVPPLEDKHIDGQTHLMKFDLGEREIRLVGSDSRDVVKYLRELFPALRYVAAVRTPSSANDLAWHEVVEALASDALYNELIMTRSKCSLE